MDSVLVAGDPNMLGYILKKFANYTLTVRSIDEGKISLHTVLVDDELLELIFTPDDFGLFKYSKGITVSEAMDLHGDIEVVLNSVVEGIPDKYDS